MKHTIISKILKAIARPFKGMIESLKFSLYIKAHTPQGFKYDRRSGTFREK